jgi:diguanylate cyclase (GGDEF)-like protein
MALKRDPPLAPAAPSAHVATGLRDWLMDIFLAPRADRVRRRVLRLQAVAICIYGVVLVVLWMQVPLGLIARDVAWALTAYIVIGQAVFYALVRSGATLRMKDPGLVVWQSGVALLGVVMGYAVSGSVRGVTLIITVVILMFGTFTLRPRQFAALGTVALIALGGVMLWRSTVDPLVYAWHDELVNFIMTATLVSAGAFLAAEVSSIRSRLFERQQQLKAALSRIEELVTRDELTGLFNRRHMQDLLDQQRQAAQRSGEAFCVAVIDLDHFKRINDTWGHAVGDEVLRTFGREATLSLRVTDKLARWGGEEFLVLATAPAAQAMPVVERLRALTQTLVISQGGDSVSFTLSAGVAEHRGDESVALTIARADAALYAAKAAGRNRVELA